MTYLAAGYYTVAQGSRTGSRGQFLFLVARLPLPIPNPKLFHFVAGLTACGIEPLGDLGNAIVASMQQIASRDSEQSQ